MPSTSRPDRIGDQIRVELSELIAREVHDPGIGFLTITYVKVTPDLQIARVYYTTLGDVHARNESQKALGRAAPFLRRQLGSRLRLRRVPRLEFFFDRSIERGDRIERILSEISAERAATERAAAGREAEAAEPRSEPGADQRDTTRADDLSPNPSASHHDE